MMAVRLLQILAGIAGLIALALGMGTYTHANLTNIHVLFGLLVSLALLVLAIIAASTSGLRRLGLISIAYALLLPIFGLTQQEVLVGDLHWLIEAGHVLVGLGALGLCGTISSRFMRLKQNPSEVGRQSLLIR